MSPAERALTSWLTEFGYMHAAGGDVRVAFRMARTERGGGRCRRELEARTIREPSRYPFRREQCPHGTAVSNHCRTCD
jgi:hypothetical protein